MNQQPPQRELPGGDHYWRDADTPAAPNAVWHEPGSGLAWMLVPTFALLLLVCWFGARSTGPSRTTPAPAATPATIAPTTLPTSVQNSPVNTAPQVISTKKSPFGQSFYYDLSNVNGEATIDTDEAKIVFRGEAYGHGCTRDTRYLLLNSGALTYSSGSISAPSYYKVQMDDGDVNVVFAGHSVSFIHNLTQLQVDWQIFDISQNKLTLAIEQDGRIVRLDQFTIPLPPPHPYFDGRVIYVDSSCQ